MDNIKAISDIIKFYHENGEKMQINELLTSQDRLASRGFYLAQVIAEKNKELAKSFIDHKTKNIKSYLSKKASKIEEKQITDSFAKAYAEDNSLAEYTNRIFLEAEVESLQLLLKQSNKVVD